LAIFQSLQDQTLRWGFTEETAMPNGPTPEQIPEPVGDPLPSKPEPGPLPGKPEPDPSPIKDPQAIRPGIDPKLN
jgi:hypothetical protein